MCPVGRKGNGVCVNRTDEQHTLQEEETSGRPRPNQPWTAACPDGRKSAAASPARDPAAQQRGRVVPAGESCSLHSAKRGAQTHPGCPLQQSVHPHSERAQPAPTPPRPPWAGTGWGGSGTRLPAQGRRAASFPRSGEGVKMCGMFPCPPGLGVTGPHPTPRPSSSRLMGDSGETLVFQDKIVREFS